MDFHEKREHRMPTHEQSTEMRDMIARYIKENDLCPECTAYHMGLSIMTYTVIASCLVGATIDTDKLERMADEMQDEMIEVLALATMDIEEAG